MEEDVRTIAKAVHAIGAVVAGLTKSDALGRSHMMDSLAELEQLLRLEAKRNPG